MAKSLSLTELTALYANKGKNPSALFEYDKDCAIGAVLPGNRTLDKLNKLYFTRQNGLSPLRSKSWPDESAQRNIAICLIIVDTLHHEEIWRHWIEHQQNIDQESGAYQAKLFIHAKYPEKVKSAWVRSHLIDVTFRPEWNSVEVVQALLSTLDTALQYTGDDIMHNRNNDNNSCNNDGNRGNSSGNNSVNNTTLHAPTVPKCGRFLFATESCLPLYDLHATGEMLFAQDCSWVNAYHTPVGTWEAGACFRAVDSDVVPPQAVWKSLPGWIVLNRRHAAEIVALTNLLGGWGQQKGDAHSSAAITHAMKDGYVGSYKGTQAEYWRSAETDGTTESSTVEATVPLLNEAGVPVGGEGDAATSDNSPLAQEATGDTACASGSTTAAPTSTPINSSAAPIVVLNLAQSVPPQTQTALLSAWGRGGSWHERNGSVFAPEEVFFPTLLSLLGYLRDQPAVSGGSSGASNKAAGSAPATEVKIATVTFAEWAKRGDANPIQYDYFEADLVTRMRRTGALLGRKFSRDSVTLAQWERVMGRLSGGAESSSRHVDRCGAHSEGRRSGGDSGSASRGYEHSNSNPYSDNDYIRASSSSGGNNTSSRYHSGDNRSHRDQQSRGSYEQQRDNASYGRNDHGSYGAQREGHDHNKRWNDDDRYYNRDNRDNKDSRDDKRRKY